MASVKECLRRLTEQNIDMSVNKHVKYLIENVEEPQLLFKLSSHSGIKIDNNIINLWYNPGVGFQCDNMFRERYGRLPLCNYIERFLNEEIRKL